MRIVCVHMPHFHVQVERLRQPELKRRPVVIGGSPEERAYVVDCSDEAAEKGVVPSLSLREAHHLCPEALFLLPDREWYGKIWDEIVYSLGVFTLRIDSEGEGIAYLDITNTPKKIYRSEEVLAAGIIRALFGSFTVKVKVGVANSRFVAYWAALRAPHHLLVIPPDDERDFLSPLGVDTLPVDEEVKDHLRLLGLRTLGKIASLSLKALVNQFGNTGRLMGECSCGKDEKRRIPVRRRKICLEKEVTGETSFETRDRLGAALGSALGEISLQLRRTGKACRTLRTIFLLENGDRDERTFIFKSPVDGEKEMLARVLDGIEGITLESPVEGFTLSVAEISRKEGNQENLFWRKALLSERLEGVKGYLEAKFGYTPLFTIEEGDEDSRLPERKFIIREV